MNSGRWVWHRHNDRPLSEEYPGAEVIGIDPFPVPPTHGERRNVIYLQGKLEDFDANHDILPRRSFDYVFSRYLILAVSDWREYIAAAVSYLKPDRWLEMQELNMVDFFSAASSNEPLHRSQDYWTEAISVEGKKLGCEHRIGSLLPSIFSFLGLTEIASSHHPHVFFPWTQRPETDLMVEYMLKRGRPAFPVIVRGMMKNSSDEQQQFWLAQVEEMYEEDKRVEGLHWRVWAVVGRKCI